MEGTSYILHERDRSDVSWREFERLDNVSQTLLPVHLLLETTFTSTLHHISVSELDQSPPSLALAAFTRKIRFCGER